MNKTPEEYLKEYFGFEQFRSGQREVIEILLQKKSALAVFPTGSGKSLCFQYSAIFFPNVTIVVSPLIALMKDQVEFLQKHNIPAAKLDSTLSWDEVKQVYSDLRDNKLKMLYVAPERLANERFANILESIQIDLMVIDEAHCISEWGHNFRPDYMKLADIAKKLSVKQVLALTATATPSVVQDICKAFEIEKSSYVNTGFYRPNLELRFTPTATSAKMEILIDRIKSRPTGAIIVYVTLQKTAENIAEALRNSQINARPYHAGLKDDERNFIQDWFMQDENAVVVATIAFGMGIDKKDLRFVYHYNLPKSLENYSQEIGRAGRDGLNSTCEMLADNSDLITLNNFTYGDTPENADIANLTNYLFQQQNQFDISLYEISNQFDMRQLVVKTYFTYLELLGIIDFVAPFYSTYKIEFLKSNNEIFGLFDANRQRFLSAVFNAGKQGPKWLTLDSTKVAEELGEDRIRIVKALNYLEEKGMINISVSGARQIYRFKNRNTGSANLILELQKLFATREERDIKMSNNLINLLKHNGCKTQFLMDYFGEQINECGHCEYCITKQDTIPYSKEEYNFDNFNLSKIEDLKSQYPDIFTTPRKITRFLCGISSPYISKTKISYTDNSGKVRKKSLIGHPDFGSLSQVPFDKVMNYIS